MLFKYYLSSAVYLIAEVDMFDAGSLSTGTILRLCSRGDS